MVRSIGADHVIDYTQEDFTGPGRRYDLIFDCIGNHSLSECRRALKPNGICVLVGDLSGRGVVGIVARLIAVLVLSRLAGQRFVTFLARPNKGDLTTMGELMKSGKLKPVIDRCYRLSETPQAVRYLSGKHARGKVVISLEQSAKI